MPTTASGGPRTANSVDEQFLALVLADEQLLKAEFDALIAHEWGSRPPPGRHSGAAPTTGPPPAQPLVPRRRGAAGRRPPRPGVGSWRRQRSPPNRPAPPGGAAQRHTRGTSPPQRQDFGMTMTVEWTDPYAVLGLSSKATQEEIRRAYRALVRQNHPDTLTPGDAGGGTASTTRLQQIIAAYATLGDPARRSAHDQRTTLRVHTRPSRVAASVRRTHPDHQPPIQAGPVHWHPSP